MAELEVDALPSYQLGGDLYGDLQRCKELREIFLFPRHISVRRTDLTADSRGHSGRRHDGDSLLRHPKVVETPRADCLVRRSDAMLLLAFRLLRQHHHILLAQWIQAQHL